MKKIVNVKCIDGKIRPKILKGLYCKFYKFSKGYFESGCCYGKKRYAECTYYDSPLDCNYFIAKADVKTKVR